MPTLCNQITDLILQHGSLRAVARVKNIDPAYLLRLASGEKCNPSPTVLRKLGLKKIVSYERIN